MEVKYFYPNNRMDISEKIMIQMSIIPEYFMIDYNLKVKVHNRYIFYRVTKGMYVLPQAVRITHYDLVWNLAPYGHHTTKNTPSLWTHENRPINFTPVIDNFGVKHYGKEHTLHLKEAKLPQNGKANFMLEYNSIGITTKARSN